MKRILAGILLLAGGLAAAGRVMRKMGRLTSIRPFQTGFVGVIGDPDRPTAFFAAKRAFPLIARDCRIRFFSTAAMLSALFLGHSHKQKKPHSKR